MSLEVQAFSSSISNAAADQQINAVFDGRIPVRDNAIVIGDKYDHLNLAWFFGVNLTVAKLKPPNFRNLGDYLVLPIQNIKEAGDQVAIALDLRFNPMNLIIGDELPAFAQQSSAGAQQANAFVMLSSDPIVPIKAQHYSVRATSAQTLTAFAWTSCNLTMDTGLPKGRYQVIGARAKSAGALAFRLIFPDQNNRPGGIAVQSDLSWLDYGQRRGEWGEWGQFDNLLIPTLEMFSVSADTSETVIMDLVKLS